MFSKNGENGKPCSLQSYMSSCFHLFGPVMKLLARKQFTTDANIKQAVAAWIQTLDNYLSYIRLQVLVPW